MACESKCFVVAEPLSEAPVLVLSTLATAKQFCPTEHRAQAENRGVEVHAPYLVAYQRKNPWMADASLNSLVER